MENIEKTNEVEVETKQDTKPARAKAKKPAATKTKSATKKTAKKSSGDKDGAMILVSLRLKPEDYEALSNEADRLNISLSMLLNIRIGATQGITSAMTEIEKMRARIDRTAEEFSCVQPQIQDVWYGVQEMRADIENYRAKDRAFELLSNRMVDVSMWRKELIDILERLEAVENKLEMPAMAVAREVERLIEGLEMLVRAGG